MPDHDPSHLDRAFARFARLHPKKIDLSLDRVADVLDRLGRPQDRLPPVLHVAGTNGKGSTVAFIRAVLEAAGRAVHVYTSPHLVRFNERVRLGRRGGPGRLVDDRTLLDAIARAEAANADRPITVFEMTTAVALDLFATHPADVCVIEVGLGGRFDATNVVDRPAAALVAPVSHDHADFLGTEIEGIAREKAGIFKRDRPAVIGPQPFPEALARLVAEAERARARPFVEGLDFRCTPERGRLVYEDDGGLLDLPPPRLAGAHQVGNAGLAIAGLRAAGLLPDAGAVGRGLQSADWPGRLQRLRAGPLVALARRDSEIWVDGGHNPGAGTALAAALGDFEERAAKPLVLIAGMLRTKDAAGFLAPFVGLAREVIAVPVTGSEAGFDPDELAGAARGVGLRARTAADVAEALRLTADVAGEAPRILIAGSLYLVGAVLAENGPLPE